MLQIKNNIVLFIITLFLSISCFGEDIIDLDTYNPDHCRQQLLNSKDNFPIIMTYFHDCEMAKKFMPVYKLVAKDHPERAFYRYDYESAIGLSNLSICLEQLGGAFSPQLRIFNRYKDPSSGQIYMTPPIRIDGSANWTKEDVEKFINILDLRTQITYLNTRAGN